MKSKKRRLSHRSLRLRKSLRQRLFLRGEQPGCCFLAGHQRSGTNMVMDVLEKHWMTDVYHENDPRAFQDFEMRDVGVIEQLLGNTTAKVLVVKALCELDMLDGLMARITPSRTIWVVRHYSDVTNSMVRSFGTSLDWYRAIKEDRSAGGWRSRNLSDEHFAWVQKYIDEDATERCAAALQWAIRNSIYFDKGLDQRGDVHLVFYENLVANPAEEFRRIYEFLDLPLLPETYADVFAGSVGKEPPPALLPNIETLCESVWDRYRRLL